MTTRTFLRVPREDVCPHAGEILITTPTGVAAVSFPGGGALEIDVGDDGTTDDSSPTCLDPRLAMCTA